MIEGNVPRNSTLEEQQQLQQQQKRLRSSSSTINSSEQSSELSTGGKDLLMIMDSYLIVVGYPPNIERMFETFHQSPHGDFKPTFYNPFEIKHRRRTTKAQFRVLETAFQENNKPNAGARRTLAAKLGMTPRAVQVWFQNRRAKNKTGKNGYPTSDDCSASPSMSTSMADIMEGSLSSHCHSHSHSHPPPPSTSSSSTSSSTSSRVEKSRISSNPKIVNCNSNNLGRRHSMPDIQLVNSVNALPFKELHEAIFGRLHGGGGGNGSRGISMTPLSFPSDYAINTSTSPILSMSSSSHRIGGGGGGGGGSYATTTRKNSGCSSNFLNSFLNLGLTTSLDHFGIVTSNSNAPTALYDPMISGDSNGGRTLRSGSNNNAPTDLTAPSISAPGSSPNLATDELFQLHNALRSGQAPNAAAVEAMAARLSNTLSPLELDILLQNVSAANHHQNKRDPTLDFYSGSSSDLANLLFSTGEGGGSGGGGGGGGGSNGIININGNGSVNPMELLSCLPHVSDQFLFVDNYHEDPIETSFP